MIEEYLLNRANLRLVILLIDFRHNPTEDDILMYNFLKSFHIPCLVVGTKSDKITKNRTPKRIKELKGELVLHQGDMFIPYSSVLKTNMEEIYQIINNFTMKEK